jgi:hypothetical protein
MIVFRRQLYQWLRRADQKREGAAGASHGYAGSRAEGDPASAGQAKDGNRGYYQVAYRLLDPKTVEREFSVLEAVPDSFPKTVLTLDRIPMKRNGIHHCYLPAWLLGQVN